MTLFHRWLIMIFALSAILPACSQFSPTASDQAALQSLQEAGSDLTKPHPFDFYLYHSEQSGALNVCDQLQNEGFKTTLREGANSGEWLCLASKTFIPSLENLAEIQSHLSDLAGQYGGEYDGWEAMVVP